LRLGMADTSKSPRPPTKSTKNDGGDESWKDSKPSKSDPKGDRGKGNYKVNDVDLSAVLPVPMYYQFTDDEKKMFAEFRKASKTCTDEDSDYIIGRFLVARKFKLKDSVELFDSARAWREKEVCNRSSRFMTHTSFRTSTTLLRPFPIIIGTNSFWLTGQLPSTPRSITGLKMVAQLFMSVLVRLLLKWVI